ncbi:MAG: hypothetical protein IT449_04650 [Phycisphaerales bacterium]|nr:hypothetical protein [Phycisphaerales bacterium]
MNARTWIAGIGLLLLVSSGIPLAVAQSPADPPEEKRFDSGPFLNALRQRGLVDLLELYLKEHPPKSTESRYLLEREIQRAKFSDRSLPRSQRMAALAEANAVLERLIAERPKDGHLLEWMSDLAYSLVFEQAEAPLTSLLYHGGGEPDRKALRDSSDRALALLSHLKAEINAEYDRIDALPLEDFEKLEKTGQIERLERTVAPKADYAWLWALYQNALSRTTEDEERGHRLTALLSGVAAHAEWSAPGAGFEPQMLLLSGMGNRLAGDAAAAEDFLTRAVGACRNLPDDRRRDLGWVGLLAQLERARTMADAGRFEDALAALDQLRSSAPAELDMPGGVPLITTLCERQIHLQRAVRESAAGKSAPADQARRAGSAAVARLLHSDPSVRDRLYAILYEQIGPDADPAALDTLQKAALSAGLLAEADRLKTEAAAAVEIVRKHELETRSRLLYEKASGLGESTVAAAADDALAPEILFNAAAAAYRLDQTGKAALGFLKAARDYPAFSESLKAATLAVQITSDLLRQASPGQRDAARQAHLDALETLLTRHPRDPASAYWRFFYAQALEDAQRSGEAADQYLLVESAHEHAIEAGFLRARCQAKALENVKNGDPADTRRRATDILDAVAGFIAKATPALQDDRDPARAERFRSLLAEAALLPAELNLLPAIDKPQDALEALDALEQAALEQGGAVPPALKSRVLLARLSALARLGRIPEVGALLPGALATDPAAAGTLAKLHDDLRASAGCLPAPPQTDEARMRARMAALLAKSLAEWARDRTDVSAADKVVLRLQYGEALLETGDYAAAREVFSSCGGEVKLETASGPAGQGKVQPEAGSGEAGHAPGQPESGSGEAGRAPARPESGSGATGQGQALPESASGTTGHARARLGLAEAMYGMGDFAAALPMFNELARPGTLPTTEPAHWRALIRDLQCRLALAGDPRDVLKVIENHRATTPTLGGPAFAAEFDKLKREAQRKLQNGTSPQDP